MTLSSVLVVHNYYQQPGGEDHVFQAECALLESRGHRVIRHSVRNDELTGMTSARLARITLWNRGAYHELRRLIRREQPDCAHFHLWLAE